MSIIKKSDYNQSLHREGEEVSKHWSKTKIMYLIIFGMFPFKEFFNPYFILIVTKLSKWMFVFKTRSDTQRRNHMHPHPPWHFLYIRETHKCRLCIQKLEVWRRRRRNFPSEDQRYCKGTWVKKNCYSFYYSQYYLDSWRKLPGQSQCLSKYFWLNT